MPRPPDFEQTIKQNNNSLAALDLDRICTQLVNWYMDTLKSKDLQYSSEEFYSWISFFLKQKLLIIAADQESELGKRGI